MKKIMLFAVSCVALAACTKDIDTTTPGDASYFVKGQKVTLSVSAGEQTKVSSVLGTTGEDKDKVNFKWQAGDKILVTVEGYEPATFTLKGDGGSSTGEFEGEMPGDGTTFNVKYPAGEDDPVLTTQTYSSTEAIPHGMMKFTATGCKVGTAFTLEPQYAALRLNLYGGAREVSQIVVTVSSNSTYTLSINPAVTVGKDKGNATPFFIVLPATEKFSSAAVTANAIAATTENIPTYTEGTFSGAGIPISSSTTFTPLSKTLTAGRILNMPAKSITTVWAPVNCGYDETNYPMGLLYQWGRKYGQAYEEGNKTPETMTKLQDTEENKGKFALFNDGDYNWFTGGIDNFLWLADSKGTKDPCPEGWRVPTKSELEALIANKSSWITDSQNGYYFSGSTAYSESAPRVFLPANGYRNTNGKVDYRGTYGEYWSSSPTYSEAFYLDFSSMVAYISEYGYRAYGYSVRCVQE